ncbi:hypothetical protein Q5752_007093 [Cryptotrichosporon argae]
MSHLAPPPRRAGDASASSSTPASGSSTPSRWASMKAKSTVWGAKAMEKGVLISDKVGGRVNAISEKHFGTEAFWPVTGDFPKEMDKAARILRAFTVDGVVKEEKVEDAEGKKKPRKVLRKIPPEVMRPAKGVAIFTSMRSGIAPLGGAGGAGVVIGRLADGSWSAPASITPNNLSTGFLIGVDVYDCVLIIRTQKALDSFATHKVTLGTEIAVAAGPYGAGAAVEAGIEKAPVFSYVRSRGFYAGVEIVGQVFVERFEENAAMYHWPGVKAGDILSGKVKIPLEAANLQAALKDAESGKAQREQGAALDIVLPTDAEADAIDLHDGEVLRLPPTPDMTTGDEYQSDPETERVRHEHQATVPPGTYALPPGPPPTRKFQPPPSHPRSHPTRLSGGTPGPSTPGAAIPALPPRHLAPRPTIPHQASSTSHYSEDGDDLPPAYEGDGKTDVKHAQGPSEHAGPAGPGAGCVPQPSEGDEPMSESERREWEQFLAEHKEDEERRQVSVDGVTGGINRLKVEDDSLL